MHSVQILIYGLIISRRKGFLFLLTNSVNVVFKFCGLSGLVPVISRVVILDIQLRFREIFKCNMPNSEKHDGCGTVQRATIFSSERGIFRLISCRKVIVLLLGFLPVLHFR